MITMYDKVGFKYEADYRTGNHIEITNVRYRGREVPLGSLRADVFAALDERVWKDWNENRKYDRGF